MGGAADWHKTLEIHLTHLLSHLEARDLFRAKTHLPRAGSNDRPDSSSSSAPLMYDCAGQDLRMSQQPLNASGRRSPAKNIGRRRTPTLLPINAATNQTQPCRLPEAMPLKYAPMLQP